MKKLLAFALIAAFSTSAVFAQAPRSNRSVNKERHKYNQRIDQRADRNLSQLHQDIRSGINHGVENRRISQKDARRLLKEHDRISQQEIKLRAKKGLSNREERQLIASLSELRQKVYNETGIRGNRGTASRW